MSMCAVTRSQHTKKFQSNPVQQFGNALLLFLKAIINHSRNAFAVSVKTICKRDKVKMRVEFELPDIGIEAGDEVTLSFWHVEEDEEFVEGDDIMEVSTSKATFNIPAHIQED